MPDFKQVDVFTKEKFKGNPVAVFLDADHLSDAQLAQMSAWTNLSEATFVVKKSVPEADYKVRIFSLEAELPFAGHPTIGTCQALLDKGLIVPKNGKVVQECGAGLVELSVSDDGEILFALPYVKKRPVLQEHSDAVVAALGAKAAVKSTIYEVGPVWHVVELESADHVLALEPDYPEVERLTSVLQCACVQVLGAHEPGYYETRTFAPAIGIKEDPVCGSGSGASGAILRDFGGFAGKLKLRQGTALNRNGQVTVQVTYNRITVGGYAVTVIDGTY